MRAFSTAFVSLLAIVPRSFIRSYQRLPLADLNSFDSGAFHTNSRLEFNRREPTRR
jgi:hypothetical protein